MPNRKKLSKALQKSLDIHSEKQPQTRIREVSNGEPGKQDFSREEGVSTLNSHEIYPVLRAGPQNPEKPKRGRRTIAENFLVGGRNNWHSFLERYWHEIGWPFLEIRRCRTTTMEEIRRIFEPLQGKQNTYCADNFLRGDPQAVTAKELRANRIKASKLHYEIQNMHSQRQEIEFSCAIAENALKDTCEEYREAIETEAKQRKERLRELNANLQVAQARSSELDKMVRGQETWFYCSQLLAYLCKGNYAVRPFALANAFAGSPVMGWRQSLARCAKMPRSSIYREYPYNIFLVISRIWRRRSKYVHLSPTELFKAEIPKLRKGGGESYSYLSEGWRDLCLAIVECSKAGHGDKFMPFALTQAFLKYRSRSKSQADQIMDEREKLTPKSNAET